MHPGRLYQGNQRLELLWLENRSRQTIAATTLKPLFSNSCSRRFSFVRTVGSARLTSFLELEIDGSLHTWAALCRLRRRPISVVSSWSRFEWVVLVASLLTSVWPHQNQIKPPLTLQFRPSSCKNKMSDPNKNEMSDPRRELNVRWTASSIPRTIPIWKPLATLTLPFRRRTAVRTKCQIPVRTKCQIHSFFDSQDHPGYLETFGNIRGRRSADSAHTQSGS